MRLIDFYTISANVHIFNFRLNTQGVIRKVGDLFVEHSDLITGFNYFLPSNYEIEVHGNILRVIEPDGTSEIVLKKCMWPVRASKIDAPGLRM